ncbi:hypothetical protein B9479_008302, partial [Cryptococcus floricola]
MAAVSLTPPDLTGPSDVPLRPRLASPTISRNPSSSSHSITTVSSTSSIQAAPMRPPPPETRTAATDKSQMGSRYASDAEDDAHYDGPRTGPAGGRGGGWTRNGPRTVTSAANLNQSPQPRYPIPPSIITSSASPSPILTNRSRPRQEAAGGSPTTSRGASFAAAPDASLDGSAPLRVTISIDPEDPHNHTHHPRSGAASPLDT